MAVSLTAATQTALDGGRIADRGMILFDFASGLYGFWTGLGPFTYSGVTYVGAGTLIAVDNLKGVSDLSSVPVVVRLTGIANSDLTPDVLATVEAETYHQRPVTILTAYFDADARVLLSVETEYRGYVDRIVHADDEAAVLEVYLESRFRDHQKSGYRVRSDADQRRIAPNDGGLRHAATVHTETVLFGRLSGPEMAWQSAMLTKKAKRGIFG